jgi:hypothetical protein
MNIIMGATLHPLASNTYYGQWLRRLQGKVGLNSGANAHSPGRRDCFRPCRRWLLTRFPSNRARAAPAIFFFDDEKDQRAIASFSFSTST